MIGNPNVGKTSLFNVLTGSRQHVGNWPGVTIEKKTGSRSHNGYTLQITDLPGTYSLATRSPDEAVANDFITTGHPDLVVQVVDSTNLERNLYLTTQLLDMGLNVILALNMSDMSESRGDVLDTKKFSEAWGIPAIRTSATLKEGIDDLLDAIIKTYNGKSVPRPVTNFGPDAEKKVAELVSIMRSNQFDTPSLRWIALRLMEGVEDAPKLSESASAVQQLEAALQGIDKEEMEMSFVDKRYEAITSTLGKVYRKGTEKRSLSDSLDRVLTNKWLGIPIFLALMWGIFQLTFTVAAPFSDMIDTGFSWLGGWIDTSVQPDWLASLLGDGIIGGVGTVLVFVPNILIMFLLLAILEDSGYLARAAFIMDRIMSKLGLHGKSFIPMLLGFGCNVPAIMGARTIEDKNSRLITIMTIPYMSCNARLPVFILFAGVFFPAMAGTVVFGLYFLGIVVAIGSALLFRHTILKGESSPFIMELPPYRKPKLGGTLLHMWERGSQYLKKAGTFIFAAAMVIWALASLPFGVEYGSEASYAGALGHALAPLLSPLGFDWRITVALVFGFFAKEVVVGALGVLYQAGEGNGLSEAIGGSMTAPVALGLMSFVLVYTPCVATLAVMWRETRSWKLTAFQVVYSLVLAYVLAFVVYHVSSFLM